jgi:cytoskeletal protein RodZ
VRDKNRERERKKRKNKGKNKKNKKKREEKKVWLMWIFFKYFLIIFVLPRHFLVFHVNFPFAT